MNKPFIALCPEITRANALTLMDWLEDEDVTRYLSDSRHVSRFIEQVIGRVQLPILTHLFNQGGRFFMAYDGQDVPVGFVRLVKVGRDCEMVLVIGNRDNWGRKLGASAIREGMKLAFFEMRAERLIAKIHPENVRSLNAFLRSGVLPDSETPAMKSLVMSSARYLRLLRERPAVHAADIYITEIDKTRLRNLIDLEQGPGIFELEHEIERAVVVAGDHLEGGSGALAEHLPGDDVRVVFEIGNEDFVAGADAAGWLDGFLFAQAGPIYAGTNEIQRNIIAERMLGLPKS